MLLVAEPLALNEVTASNEVNERDAVLSAVLQLVHLPDGAARIRLVAARAYRAPNRIQLDGPS